MSTSPDTPTPPRGTPTKGEEGGMNWSALAGDVSVIVVEQMKGVIEGAADDLRQFGWQISSAMVVALALGEKQLTAQLKAQIRLLAEISRVRLVKVEWHVAENIFELIFRVAAAAIGARVTGR